MTINPSVDYFKRLGLLIEPTDDNDTDWLAVIRETDGEIVKISKAAFIAAVQAAVAAGLVPYTGATANLDLGDFEIKAFTYRDNANNLIIDEAGIVTSYSQIQVQNGLGFKGSIYAATLTDNRSYNLPDKGGDFAMLDDINAVIETTGTAITFTGQTIYNSDTAPATSNITNDLTAAKKGIVQKIYHNNATEPTYPAGWVLVGGGTYATGVLNIIYAEWCGGTRVEYWIVQEA